MRRADLTAVSLTLAANALVHGVLPEAAHVPANLATAAAVVGVARWDGASWEMLGLAPADLGRGVRYGAAAAGAIVAGVAVVAAVPALREHFLDERVTAVSDWRAAYEVGIRIPYGTALSEEVLFRGALPALVGAVPSNVLFGLWHVLPTHKSLETHPAGAQVRATRTGSVAAIASTVAATAAAGFAFTALRKRSRSVLAPAIAHAALNASTYVAARLIARTRTAEGTNDGARAQAD